MGSMPQQGEKDEEGGGLDKSLTKGAGNYKIFEIFNNRLPNSRRVNEE